ncbi:DNA-binding NarL/FixJ family response regulator [Flavobacterium sp. 7E]|uniref:response regulator n=1 Tax=unclassified Flavobacterium TaxID=196869 RepID=UPI00156D6C9C|nr:MULTISPECIES: response regulator transcription factor [unclassified Flavobacterium]NRS88184.1 DNA-binding NarL/FixJ family response regulator [Flavobacterium sp. 7E]NRT15644.1 DNA-binding NarL/FixJ family response regulator [Flavobacterium sp. 28A]
MEEKIRIHLADDHQVLIDGMKTLLNTVENFEVVGFSLDGNTIFEEVTNNKSHILVLDISMPNKDGIEVMKEFSTKGFPCKVIVLSSYDDLKIIKEVMKLGASGYLTKQCAGESIVEAIQFVNNGQEYFCDTVREKIFNTATKDNSKLNKNKSNALALLTEREIEVITLIALEYSGKEISEHLFISSNTVETHRKNIMKKLKAKNTISLVKYAIKNKLIKS